MNNNYFKSGTSNFICDICGQKYKRIDGRLNWQQLLVCFNCYEDRHPVTLPLPTVIDGRAVLNSRTRPTAKVALLPEGLSVWGQSYITIYGPDPDATWNTCSDTWNGQPSGSESIYIGE